MSFLACILNYLIEMAVLIAVGILGASIGIRLRKNKDAKVAAVEAGTTRD